MDKDLQMTTDARKSKKGDLRRKSILMAGRELFLHTKFNELRIEAIAEAAGISKATLYQYFDGKAEIYEAILLSDVDELVGGLRDNWTPESRLETNIRRLTYFYISFFVRHQEYFGHMSFYWLPGRELPLPVNIMERVRSYLAEAIDTIANCLDEAANRGEIDKLDSQITALSIWSVWEGTAWIYATGRCRQFDRDVYDLAIRGIELIVSGLRTGKAELSGVGPKADGHIKPCS